MSENGLMVRREDGLAETGHENPAVQYLLSLQSKMSRTVMARRLNALAQKYFGSKDAFSCPWHRLRLGDLRLVVDGELDRGMSVAYTNQSLAALRGVARACFELKQIDAETYMRLKLMRQATGGLTEPAGRYLSREEREQMISACDKTPMGRRDSAILLCFIALGLRRSEVEALDYADLKEERIDGVRVYAVTVHGKGRKVRVVYADNGAFWALHDWLAVRGDKGGALFPPGHKSGRLYPPKRLSERGIYFLVGRRAKDAGVPDIKPHDFRRSLTSDLLDAGVDLVTVSHILGHANPRTTSRYDRRGERAKKKAAGTLTWAYERA